MERARETPYNSPYHSRKKDEKAVSSKFQVQPFLRQRHIAARE